MSKTTRSKPLSLGIPKDASPISSTLTSPTDGDSNLSSPSGAPITSGPDSLPQPRLGKKDKLQTSILKAQDKELPSPDITSLPPFPSSPKSNPKHQHDSSRGFFSNLKASKSSNKVHTTLEPTIRQVSEELSRSKIDLTEGGLYSRPSPGSTPDLSLSNFDHDPIERSETPGTMTSTRQTSRHLGATSPPPDDSSGKLPADASNNKKSKPRFAHLMSRSRSIRTDDSERGSSRSSAKSGGRKAKPVTPIITTNAPQIHLNYGEAEEARISGQGPPTPMTAPLPADRFALDDESRGPRNRSADRGPERAAFQQPSRNLGANPAHPNLGVFKDGAGSHLFNNIRNTSSRAAGGLNKAGKGIMAKMNRSGSSNSNNNNNNNKEEERYVCQVINLPLVEQTRRTRLADRLENSKDRTEFWMPALPWRCIDYLNFRGCEEEGLYRIPGSDREIRQWQKRFDQEGDINLFDEPDLYDVNVVGSLFKAWLRELPTDIFPKSIQNKIYQANPDATEVPQMLKDELSLLPPWNYYLLFATTCHLSLLSAYSDKNRMTYGNLVICFQPCLRIDSYCFQFLVEKWRDCWQGCWTEKETLEEEYKILDRMATGDEMAPGSSGGSSGHSGIAATGSSVVSTGAEDRSIASSSGGSHLRGRPPPLTLSTTDELSQVSYNRPQKEKAQNGHARSASQLPELAPVQPLSPIGL